MEGKAKREEPYGRDRLFEPINSDFAPLASRPWAASPTVEVGGRSVRPHE
jgi:hypothetical protein